MAKVTHHVVVHLQSSEEHVAGWLVGARSAEGEPVLLGAVRCTQYAAHAPRSDGAAVASPDWAREGQALCALLPVGLSVVGYYASAVLAGDQSADAIAATPAARAAAFFRSAPRNDGTWPTDGRSGAPCALLVAIAAQQTPGESATVHIGRASLVESSTWQPCDAASLDDAAARWLDSAACVRVSCELPVSVASSPQPRWRAACAEALAEAERSLDDDALCFTVFGAPELGILPLGAGASAALTVGDAVAATVAAGSASGADPKRQEQRLATARDQLMLELVWDVTPASFEAGACAPVLTTVPATSLRGPTVPSRVQLQVAALYPNTAALSQTAGALRLALRSQLRRLLVGALGEVAEPPPAPAAVPKAKPSAGSGAGAGTCVAGTEGPRLVGCAFQAISGSASPPAFHAEYVFLGAPDSAEANARAARAALHARLGLPTDRPLLRTTNALPAPGSAARSTASRLVNVHKHCPPSGVKGGMLAVVRGDYEYYHYMQDNFDDKGWGCAYRSLMTIISWFNQQQYTHLPVPMHAEIQRRLVSECAQPAALLNSRRWIGALDVSLFLEVALGVTCRIENFSTGAELAQKGRLLLRHFETQGTPVMMGGGELAYTLLGVHFDDKSGDIRFLILDPHYTGNDDVPEIVSKKWCGWHTADKFAQNAFYNLCFPLCPDCI